jgi:multidrug efflux pump subunit AcrB
MRLEDIPLTAGDGVLVSLQGLAHVTQSTLEPSIYRKGMRRVVHVTSEVSEAEENPKYAIFRMNEAHDHLRLPAG